ncbi:MAG: NAD-dependent epimerase/dehydratase family protein [Bradyrhizobium sp.]|uniref:NAD-dependent epimerase/dehydratase family protein n=1 Tax=Bradyrhizobium sp. TaxID=376 RepID=UPI0029A407EE|nr:NAD-dependent epimerase/dehydratase family protein [Bradyrhizobium sp.]MDX3969791.1 NAD-dependent epimerase/dehydratase family protein [Bradyrhizobium sp.]
MHRSDRVLVTGASGFIGGRLTEALVSRGMTVRAATSDVRHCSRIASLPVELVEADLNKPDTLARAAEGCDVVFHVAYRFGGDLNQQAVNFEGTQVLADAFHRSGGRRFVHVSSMCAYGDPRDEDLTEDTPLRPSEDPYSATKRKIDLLLLDMHRSHGLPVSILQPSIVYGPYGTAWTAEPLRHLRTTRIALPNRGSGLCNAVYVDDVVASLLLAAESVAAVGEMFLVSGSAPVTWREFYGAFEKMAGKTAIVEFDEQQFELERRKQQRNRSLIRRIPRALANRAKPSFIKAWAQRTPSSSSSNGELPLFLPDGLTLALLASRTHIRIDKARRLLGYEPAFDLARGMELTEQWAGSAGLLAA